ncbi:hypothetical protein DL93DRAFT_2076717 [Clavulina sp. PMI_390]|nr:hypothetical protein DL93DRAFT_2076717 [Clavulina sp. PMI_390]
MPSISHLPAELVLTIAEHSLQRHPDECYVVNSADLASLSSTSARLRAILAPLLFTEVAVTTQEQLVALSRVGQARLASTR